MDWWYSKISCSWGGFSLQSPHPFFHKSWLIRLHSRSGKLSPASSTLCLRSGSFRSEISWGVSCGVEALGWGSTASGGHVGWRRTHLDHSQWLRLFLWCLRHCSVSLSGWHNFCSIPGVVASTRWAFQGFFNLDHSHGQCYCRQCHCNLSNLSKKRTLCYCLL